MGCVQLNLQNFTQSSLSLKLKNVKVFTVMVCVWLLINVCDIFAEKRQQNWTSKSAYHLYFPHYSFPCWQRMTLPLQSACVVSQETGEQVSSSDMFLIVKLPAPGSSVQSTWKNFHTHQNQHTQQCTPSSVRGRKKKLKKGGN